MADVPKLNVSQAKLDQLAKDLAALAIPAVIKMGDNSPPIPTFQRQGYLEKLGHSRTKWFRRFFVLRDSFLLSYNLQKSDYTVEPRACVHLGNSKIQLLSHADKEFCLFITTMEKDQFLFAAQDEDERQAWVKDIEIARSVTHANMVKLSVENQCLAEEKGVADVARDASTTALGLFSNPDYIRNTPLIGGAEGWLRTFGFNPDHNRAHGVFKAKKSQLKKAYFMLRDSHLLMFHGGDILTKPRGVMYLVGTTTEEGEVEEGVFRFTCVSKQCGDLIELVASNEKQRQRWITALTVGARVTYPDFKMLLKEHELLAAVAMTPRAAPSSEPNRPAPATTEVPAPIMVDDMDLQGQQLDPGTLQPYDIEGNPLLRNPDGKIVNHEGEVLPAKTPRFAASGQQLDPFNRPLPPGAVPMFTGDQQPIGVGPDGRHYLPDGTLIEFSDPHFDADGNQLDQATVDAAGAIASDVNVAIKVRARLKADGAVPEAVDALGRTFRELNDAKSGVLINADGEQVPTKSARRIETNTGLLVEYEPLPEANDESTHTLIIKVDEEGDEREIGSVEITSTNTLRDVRNMIDSDLSVEFSEWVFLVNNVQLLKAEETDRIAKSCLPEIVVRSRELKTFTQSNFSRKVEERMIREAAAERERKEFQSIQEKIRQGKFLKPVKRAQLE
eukprot:c19568_g1_i1.p1 GENE.c19568_g1_i1~~c19568_g1_i1.p1  ORF type:complete len:681 (-),score=177.84 c19568_g1_i1:108-2123(-)